ncbi:MAG: GNAT family N-acetyltransferase [Pseudomonadota bacterium]
MDEKTDVVPLTREDVSAAAALSATFGWPHRQEDWALMLRIGEGLKIQHEDALTGTVMWWPLGADAATLGMVMVPKHLQGQGVGTKLMQAALAANAGKTLRLNATPEGMALYRSAGFRDVGVICQNQGIAQGTGDTIDAVLAGRYVASQIMVLDRKLTGLQRSHILETLAMVSNVAISTDTSGELSGYALCRAFGMGRVIGPVVASDTLTAKALIALFLDRYKGQFLRIDTPALHGLSPWLAAHGLIEVEPATAMRQGADDLLPAFALASQALG